MMSASSSSSSAGIPPFPWILNSCQSIPFMNSSTLVLAAAYLWDQQFSLRSVPHFAPCISDSSPSKLEGFGSIVSEKRCKILQCKVHGAHCQARYPVRLPAEAWKFSPSHVKRPYKLCLTPRNGHLVATRDPQRLETFVTSPKCFVFEIWEKRVMYSLLSNPFGARVKFFSLSNLYRRLASP